MKAILIDDEKLALTSLERQLSKIGNIHVAAVFQNPLVALEQAKEIAPDIAFLDIDMPVYSGIETAEMLLSMMPEIEIVFVTAYEEYAVKAFELNAIDYVLKPINQARLTRTVERIEQRLSGRPMPVSQTLSATAQILCFKRLQIDVGMGEPFPWRTARSQELFAYLLSHHQEPVRKDVLLELLWPNAEYKKGFTQLYTTIYQIRKSLENAGLSVKLTNSGSDYYLDLGPHLTDVMVWENTLQQLPPLSQQSVEQYCQWLEQYTGHYLEEHNYLWAESESRRLSELWYKHAMELLATCQQSSDWERALELSLRLENLFPHMEEVYFASMKLLVAKGRPHLAIKKYEQLCNMLNEEYGASPAEAIQDWINNLA